MHGAMRRQLGRRREHIKAPASLPEAQHTAALAVPGKTTSRLQGFGWQPCRPANAASPAPPARTLLPTPSSPARRDVAWGECRSAGIV